MHFIPSKVMSSSCLLSQLEKKKTEKKKILRMHQKVHSFSFNWELEFVKISP